MTTIPQRPAYPCSLQQQEQIDPLLSSPVPATLSDLSTLSTLWMPLDATIQAWASFGKEALTFSALLAVSEAFCGLAWETKALRHTIWATQEEQRRRWRKVVFWLRKAVEDLDCATSHWNQALCWLDIAGNDDQQQDPACLDTIRTLMQETSEQQKRRQALSQQVAEAYATAHERQQEGRPR